MKKLLAIILTVTLVLSLSAAAFADGSPTKEITVDDLPGESELVESVVVEPEKDGLKVEVVPNKELNDDEKESMNEALDTVVNDGSLPVDGFAVKIEGGNEDGSDIGKITVTFENEDQDDFLVYIIYPDGTVVMLQSKDLVVREDGRYEIEVYGPCNVVIAKQA